jgi:hypothetical protein
MIRLLLLSLLLLTACRTIQKASSSSNTAQMEAESNKYSRETVTEYIVRDTATGKPVIVNVMPAQSGQISTQQPLIITQKEPYIIRQTIRETGEQQIVKAEQSQTETKEKEAGVPILLQWAAIIIAIAILCIAVVMVIKTVFHR